MKKIRTTNQLRKKDGSYARAGNVIDVVDGKAPFIELPSARSGSPLHSAQTRLRQPTTAVLEQLSGALAEVTEADHPRTFKLLQSGRHKLSRKVIEEACEVTVEAIRRDYGRRGARKRGPSLSPDRAVVSSGDRARRNLARDAGAGGTARHR